MSKYISIVMVIWKTDVTKHPVYHILYSVDDNDNYSNNKTILYTKRTVQWPEISCMYRRGVLLWAQSDGNNNSYYNIITIIIIVLLQLLYLLPVQHQWKIITSYYALQDMCIIRIELCLCDKISENIHKKIK